METNEKQPQEVYAGPVSMTEKAITLPSRQATQQSLASMKELDSVGAFPLGALQQYGLSRAKLT